jgi:hypothetical protein
VQDYFKIYGRQSVHKDVAIAYNEYASAFFKHSYVGGPAAGTYDNGFTINYPSRKEKSSIVFKNTVTRLDDDGRRLADCAGYSRLGRDLFEQAGYQLDYIQWRAKLPSNYSWPQSIVDVHSIAVLHRDHQNGPRDIAVITNEDVVTNLQAGFNVQWDNNTPRHYDGRGRENHFNAEKQLVREICRNYIGEGRKNECEPFPRMSRTRNIGLQAIP